MLSFCKIGILKNFAKITRKHLCWSLFFNKFAGLQPATLFNKKTPAQVFSCKFCKIFNNTFYEDTSDPRQPRRNFDSRHPRLFFTHTQILWTHAIQAIHAIFFDPRPNFTDPRHSRYPRQNLTHPIHEPKLLMSSTLFSRLTKTLL